jgi:hypothetical protein
MLWSSRCFPVIHLILGAQARKKKRLTIWVIQHTLVWCFLFAFNNFIADCSCTTFAAPQNSFSSNPVCTGCGHYLSCHPNGGSKGIIMNQADTYYNPTPSTELAWGSPYQLYEIRASRDPFIPGYGRRFIIRNLSHTSIVIKYSSLRKNEWVTSEERIGANQTSYT